MTYKTKGVNIVIKSEPESKYGYLKIAFRVGNKTKVKSLGIKVLKSQFNKRTQLMRSGAEDADKINEIIELKKTSFGFVSFKSHQPKTIGNFIEATINNTSVKSTKQKYENILNLFKQFVKEKYNKEDLYFEELDNQIVNDFSYWLRNKKKANNQNTANYKIKSFKSFISKIEKQGLYHYHISPFVSLEMKFDETRKEFLTLKELKTFINKNFEDNRKDSLVKFSLKDVKDAFIFSTLAQGLRISDILTLRWNDFDFDNDFVSDKSTLVIRKKMIKTKKLVSVFINADSIVYLENQIERIFNTYLTDDNTEIIETFNHYKDLRMDIDRLNNEMGEKKFNNFLGDDPGNEIVWTDPKLMKEAVHKNYIYQSTEEFKYEIQKLKISLFIDIHSLVNYLSTNKRSFTKFVFPFLDDKLFENINYGNDFSKINDEQFLQFQGRRSYTTTLLKSMIKQIISSKNITFHSSRHTYTSLMLDIDKDGMNMYDLMRMLGHTSLLSTEKYARGLNSKKINKLNMNLTNALFLNEEE